MLRDVEHAHALFKWLIMGGLFSAFISVMKGFKSGKPRTWAQRLAEATINGAISAAIAVFALRFVPLSPAEIVFGSGFLGYLGAEAAVSLAARLFGGRAKALVK